MTCFEMKYLTFIQSNRTQCAVLYLIVPYDSEIMRILIRISQWLSGFLVRNPEIRLLKPEGTRLNSGEQV